MTEHLDPFDELAALFLTDGDTPAPRAPAEGVTIELLEVGSLPVRAALWLPPYADAVARQLGPTALLRLDLDIATLQILQAPADLSRRTWPTITDAVAELSGRIANWVIRPALGTSATRLAAAGVDRITILSSANESARVDAYRRIKGLVEAAEANGAPVPAISLAVLGADPQTAALMHERLNTTTLSFLNLQVPMAACVQRIDAMMTASATQHFEAAPKPSLDTVLGWLRAAAPTPATKLQHEEPPPIDPRIAEPPPAPTPTPTPPASPAPPELVGAPMKMAPKPAVDVEPKDLGWELEPCDAHGRPVPLASYIDGVTPLDARCPDHEKLELGVDANGRLHVVAREADLRAMHYVASWAAKHREILERLSSGQSIDPAVAPVLHVFTDRPVHVTDLHGSDLHLHVLAPVDVGGRRGWYAAPLNQ